MECFKHVYDVLGTDLSKYRPQKLPSTSIHVVVDIFEVAYCVQECLPCCGGIARSGRQPLVCVVDMHSRFVRVLRDRFLPVICSGARIAIGGSVVACMIMDMPSAMPCVSSP